jgi:hypothetical protein
LGGISRARYVQPPLVRLYSAEVPASPTRPIRPRDHVGGADPGHDAHPAYLTETADRPHAAFPDELDEVEAAALAGALRVCSATVVALRAWV